MALETGTIIALFGAILTTLGACGTVVAILVRMRRDVDTSAQSAATMRTDIAELRSDYRSLNSAVTDLRIEFGKFSSAMLSRRHTDYRDADVREA